MLCRSFESAEERGRGRGLRWWRPCRQEWRRVLAAEASVEILMTNYQGESWSDVQIATIVAQDYDNWRLLIRDDGSTDRTLDILRFWRDRFPDKIMILDEHNPQNLGLAGNVSALMTASSAPYVMFSSWDDVWYRDKVSNAVRAIRSLEAKYGAECPLLIHTDMRMVDANLHELYPSARKRFGVVPSRNLTVGRFCLENTASGPIIVNRGLLQLGNPIPRAAKAEDWWLALVAAAFGVIEARPEVSMDYRRHGVNLSDVPLSLLASLRSVITHPLRHRRAFYAKLAVNQELIQAFLDSFDGRLSPRDRATVQAFLALPKLGFWARRRAILQHRIFYSSWARTAGLLLLV